MQILTLVALAALPLAAARVGGLGKLGSSSKQEDMVEASCGTPCGDPVSCAYGCICYGGAGTGTCLAAAEIERLEAAKEEEGQTSTLAGDGSPGHADGLGTSAQFEYPHSLAFDASSGDIFVADTGRNVIRAVASDNGAVTFVAGNQCCGFSGYADGIGEKALFYSPRGVAVDPSSGIVWVADSGNNCIRKMANTAVTTIGGAPARPRGFEDGIGTNALFYNPTGIAYDPSTATLFVADQKNDAIRTLDVDTGKVKTIAGSGAAGYDDGAGVGTRFNKPTGVAYDPSSRTLFVADFYNNAIRAVDVGTHAVTTLAGGNANPDFADGVGSKGHFYSPQGVALDASSGTIFVGDTDNNKIRAVNLATKAVTTLAGGPLLGFADGFGTNALFWSPQGVAVDPSSGTVFVADSHNSAIRSVGA